MRSVRIAIVGATGLLGEAIVAQLTERHFPYSELFLLASENSAGKTVRVAGKSHLVTLLDDFDFTEVELAIFAAGADVSQRYALDAAEAGVMVIDLSPAFRYEGDVPLVVAGVNDELLADARERNLVACADAATVQLVRALKPLTQLDTLQEVLVTQFQSVSGRGRAGVDQLAQQSVRLLNGMDASEAGQSQVAFNVQPLQGALQENGYSSEELKLILETRRILADQPLRVQASCVGVPVFYGHGQSVTVKTTQGLGLARAAEVWQDSAGIIMLGTDDAQALTPVALADQPPALLLSRLREDLDGSGDLHYFSVADNVRYGGAENALQIAELLLKDYL